MEMNVAIQRSAAEAAYLDAFARLPKPLQRGSRKSAFEGFAATGLPHRRLEDWKWTDLRQLLDRAYPPLIEPVKAAPDAGNLLARSPFAGIARARLVFIEGMGHVPDAIHMARIANAIRSVMSRAERGDGGAQPLA